MSAVAKIIVGAVLVVVGIVAAPFTGGLSLYLVPVGLSLMVQGIMQALKGKGAPVEAGKINARIGEPVRWMNAGNCRQGGGVLFGEFDSAGNFWYVVVHSDSILTSKISVMFDDTVITLDGSGNVTSNDFCLTDKKEAYTGSGTRVTYFQVWTATYSESNPTPPAISALTAAFPTKWTSDHKLVGTTYSVIKCKALGIEDRYKIYKWRGAFGLGEPAVSIVGQWSNMFDPRDETQTNGVPTTYKPSRNAVLIWAWFRTHRYGRNKSRDSINWDKVAEQASICDQIVTGIEGDHTRYRCDTGIPEDKERAAAEQEIIAAMDAQLVFDDDGKCWSRVGYYYTPTLALSRNRDIVAMESVEAQNNEDQFQGVIVRYIDPASNYAAQPSAPWYNPNYYVEGEGATFMTVDILTVQDHNQAMRLAKSIGMRSQPLHKLAPTTGLRGLRARQERIINLNYDNTFAGDYEIYTPVEVNEAGVFCGFGLVPMDANRFTLLSGEEKPKPVFTDGDSLAAPVAPTGVVITRANGRIEATFTASPRVDVSYQFQYIAVADVASDLWSLMSVDMIASFAYGGVVDPNTSYYVRYRAVTSAGRVTAWSANVTIGAANETIGPSTLLTVTGAVGNATVTWRNPSSSNFGYSETWRGTTSVLAAATKIAGPTTGGLGQVQGFTDTITAGVYYYWNVAYSTSGLAATPQGPVSGTVT